MAQRLVPSGRSFAPRLLSPGRSSVVPVTSRLTATRTSIRHAASGTGGSAQSSAGGGLGTALAAGAAVAAVGGGAYYYYTTTQGPAAEAPPKPMSEKARKKAEKAAEAAALKARKQEAAESLRSALALLPPTEGSSEEASETAIRDALAKVEQEDAFDVAGDDLISESKVTLSAIANARTLRKTIEASLQDVRSAIMDQQLAVGLEAFKELTSAEEELSKLAKECHIVPLFVQTDIDEAKARLGDLEEISEGYKSLQEGRDQLSESLVAKDLQGAREAIEIVGKATSILQNHQQEIPSDNGLVAQSLVKIEELQVEAEVAARRDAAMKTLEDALTDRSPEVCAKAVQVALESGVEPCPSLELAKILANPTGLVQALAQEGSDRLKVMHQAYGVSVKDFAEAAAATAASMSDEELQAEASRLAGDIVRNYTLHHAELLKELPIVEATLHKASKERVTNTVDAFTVAREEMEAQKLASLEESYRKQKEAVLQQIKDEAEDEAEVKRRDQHETAMKTLGDKVILERETLQGRLQGLHEPVKMLVELAQTNTFPQQQAYVAQQLASSLLSLQTALAEGNPCKDKLDALSKIDSEEVSPFVKLVLASMPADTLKRASKHVATESELRHNFSSELAAYKAVALSPPTGGIFGHIWAGLRGHLLARFYSLPGASRLPLPPGTPTEEAESNLTTLAAAAKLVEAGDFGAAVVALEGLNGACRQYALKWVQQARDALILAQSMRALQAQANCLTSVLP
mmetsp:Transcript_75408/g.157190  ORF Transcript_75408/g.157190 Transcript_75408/m.157190 type:complete len:749 (+) Transcript_75408:99-2345(+)